MAGTPTSIAGIRQTTNIQSARRVVDMAPKIILLEDDRKALMTFVSSLGRRNVTNPQFDWLTDEILPKSFTTTATLASSNASATADISAYFGTAATQYLKTDDILKVPSTGEIIHVHSGATATSGTNGAITRNVAGATFASAASGVQVVKIGNAREEFSRVFDSSNNLVARTTQEATARNYTQTFRDTFGLSRREQKSKLYGQEERAYQRMKKLLEHAEQINNTIWHGVSASASPAGNGSGRTLTGGMIPAVPSGNTETITTLTEDEMEDFLRANTRYGSKKKVLFASRYVQQLLSAWARANQRVTQPGGTIKYGVHMTEYHAGCGAVVDVITDHALEGIPGSSTVGGWDGDAVLVDPENVKLAVFGGDYMKLEIDLELPDMDGLVDSYLSDVGLQWGNGSHHARITGVTA